jgi:hypothetical protein
MRSIETVIGRRPIVRTKLTAIPQAYICATCHRGHAVGEIMTQVLGSDTDDGLVWVNCECGSTKVLFSRRKRS